MWSGEQGEGASSSSRGQLLTRLPNAPGVFPGPLPVETVEGHWQGEALIVQQHLKVVVFHRAQQCRGLSLYGFKADT